MFGNGFRAVFFGKGQMENLRFSNIAYDRDFAPHKDDKNISIEWCDTHSEGFSAVYFDRADVKNVTFDGIYCPNHMDSLFAGNGSGEVLVKNAVYGNFEFSRTKGILINK